MRREVDMINGVGPAGTGRVETARAEASRRGGAAQNIVPIRSEATDEAAQSSPSNPAAALAALGAPIDAAKIARVRDAIASGNYPVNPQAIAEKMIALDLPARN
jgi:negative regulator of flagellin synthesis FlgM